MQSENPSHIPLPFLEEYLHKVPPNSLEELKPQTKNLDLKVIVLAKDNPKELKNREVLYQCTVADHTARIQCNFFGDLGENLKPGDIVYIMGGYTGLFKDRMVLYQSQKGGIYRLRDFFFVYKNDGPNMSDPEWNREIDAQGKEYYYLKGAHKQ